MSYFSSSSLYCPEDATDVASWAADSWAPPPSAGSSDYSSDRSISTLLDSEPHHMPESDYFRRFHDRSLDATARQDAVSWILKVHEHYNFRPVTAYLSVNYLDRFLSSHNLPRGNGWPFHLLSVACLSIAAKMEETEVPMLLDFQLFEPRFVFEPRTIRRMEVLVMASLKWRMRSVTPFDYVDFFAGKLGSLAARNAFSNRLFSRVSELILSTHRVIDFLGYRPSTIAAAAVLCAAGEMADFPAGLDRRPLIFPETVSEDEVGRCLQMMVEYLIDTCPFVGLIKAGSEPTPHSPIGVLDAAACGSCDTQHKKSTSQAAESSRSEPPIKRRKPNASPCTDTEDLL